jgi:uncharacterized SAM-binding protein YcdF (DUF218 family)
VISPREIFTALLFNMPQLRSNAVVVLAGEDGEERLKFGAGIMAQHARIASERNERFDTELIISGGVDSESQQSAKTLYPKALGMGIAHDRIVLEEKSTNTREQAVNVVAYAQEKAFRRIILVGSCYHAPRAFLTFLKALEEVGQDEAIQLVSCAADHLPWFKCPKGMKRTRSELYIGEMGKIELYREHCSSFIAGADHIRIFEGA